MVIIKKNNLDKCNQIFLKFDLIYYYMSFLSDKIQDNIQLHNV